MAGVQPGFVSEPDARRGGDEQPHLDSFASASAGLLQLSSVAAAAANPGQQSSVSSGVDLELLLPPGWNRVTHASGLPCFANFRMGLVSWSKPYTLGSEAAMLTEPDFMRLVKRHVPPLSIFVPPERIATTGGTAAAAGDGAGVLQESPVALVGDLGAKAEMRIDESGSSTPSVASPARPAQHKNEEPTNAKKRKVEAAERAVQQAQTRSNEKSASMSMEEFKTLAINDPRVLQACMELSVKTPAQVLQEYQNRNRGVSINYNTVPCDNDGVKLFKTIVTAGNTVAEGIASTKKIAKQLGAQQLLALLHERTARLYIQVADLYSVSSKNQHASSESKLAPATTSPATPSMTGQAVSNSLRAIGTLGRTTEPRSTQPSTVDIREAVDAKLRKYRRPSPTREYSHYGSSYSGGYDGPSRWGSYGQNDGSGWIGGEARVDSPGAERIVVYSSPSSAPSTNYTSHYYSGGPTPWTHPPPGGGLPTPPLAPAPSSRSNVAYNQQYSEDMSRGDSGMPRQHGQGTSSYHSRSSDRLRSKTA